jgi:ribose transport system substrate-binding protein
MITGEPGTTADVGRTAGARSVFEQFPVIRILGEESGMGADGPAQEAMATALDAFPQIDGVWCQGGDVGVLQAFIDANRPFVPIAGEAGNDFRKIARKHDIPIISVGQTPAMAAVSIRLAIEMLKDGVEIPQEIILPLSVREGKELVEGVDYFPAIESNFFVVGDLPNCGLTFAPDER